jgi:RNase P subunit RPR2
MSQVQVRYRCSACGNITRFDVVADRRTRAFYHFSVGGELEVEEEEVVSEDIVEVACRWCGHGNAIEVQDAVNADGAG